MLNWPKYFSSLMTLKISGAVAMVCIKMLILFLWKKLTGRSLSYAKTTQKAVLTPKSQQCPQCNMPIFSNMTKSVSRVVVCGYLVVSVKFGWKKLSLCALLAARSVWRGGFWGTHLRIPKYVSTVVWPSFYHTFLSTYLFFLPKSQLCNNPVQQHQKT